MQFQGCYCLLNIVDPVLLPKQAYATNMQGQGNGMEDTNKVMLSIMILELALAERICVRDAAVEMHSIDTGFPC